MFIRYSAPSLPRYPTCGHNSKAYACTTLTMPDVYHFHKSFYAIPNKIQQDNFILKYCVVLKTSRRRPKTGLRSKKDMAVTYFVRKKSTGEAIPVCKSSFLGVLCLNKNRIQGVLKRHLRTGSVASENRGGDRHSLKFLERKQVVINFVKKFKPVESHYCRGKSNRQYLSSELNITKMWRMYTASVELTTHHVKLSYFRNIFNTNFNIGFGSPRTDMCSTCLQLKEKIKMSKNEVEKSDLQTELKVHNMRAKAFFSLLKEDREGLKTFSFDCQKNQPLPKLPDQATYYSRQLYVYNFTVVIGSSKSKLNKENVHCYVWTEDEHRKGSNEIASCVYNALCSANLNGIHTVRLVADGCGGQNKNTTLLAMCSKWLYNSAPKSIEALEIIFPVTGHSFLPADRVFALIEREIKKIEVIVSPEEYYQIIEKYGKLHRVGLETDVDISDWQSASRSTFKPSGQWHFPFKATKRFILNKSKQNVMIRGETSYNLDLGSYGNVCKKGKSVGLIRPSSILIGVQPKQLKLRDVNVLLCKHYGIFWKTFETLSYYKTVLEKWYDDNANIENLEDNPEDENHPCCEVQEECSDLII